MHAKHSTVFTTSAERTRNTYVDEMSGTADERSDSE